MKKRHILNKAGALNRAGAQKRAGVFIAAVLMVLLTAGCVIDPRPSFNDDYTSFPEAEILGASFYLMVNNKDVTGDDAGTITKNEDGTYKVRMRRRAPSNVPVAMFITGSFRFSEFYSITCSFPKDAENKPYRVYACASRGMDGNVDADYPTARDLVGTSAFPGGAAEGTFRMSNEGVNYLNKDSRNRPYITVFLYLYFQTANNNDPNDFYEFTLHSVKGANGIIPESVVTNAEVYRDGDSAKCSVIIEKYEMMDPVTAAVEKKDLILGNYLHRLDSRKLSSPASVVDTNSLCIDLRVPDADAGKQIEFVLRGGAGLYSQGSTANLINRDIVMAARVLAGTAAGEQTGVVTEARMAGANPNLGMPSFEYTIKARTVRYTDMTGIKLAIGTGPFAETERFSCSITLPVEYVRE
jgi:hypothetical protein